MTNPAFLTGKLGVLFFSRGRGLGHAVPDLEIAAALLALRPDVDLRFVSYATGANAISAAHWPLFHLDLPEQNPLTLTLVLAAKLIGHLRPALVISHEEFPALPAARIFDRPVVCLTDWFLNDEHYSTQTMQFADSILFLDDAGSYPEPPSLWGRVEYLGCFARQFTYNRTDVTRARQELDLPHDAFVVLALPGAFATEARAPLADLLLPAFHLLDPQNKRLLWIAGTDAATLQARTADDPLIHVMEYEPVIDRLMVACDVAITKGNRKTVLELERLGVPQIAVCYGQNPIDEQRLQRVHGVTILQAQNTSSQHVARLLMESQTATLQPPRAAKGLHGATASSVAAHIAKHLPQPGAASKSG